MKTPAKSSLVMLAVFASVHCAAATMVFPIATNTSLVEVGGGAAFSGSNYLVGFGQNESNVCVQLVSSNGALIGSPLVVGASDNLGNPKVAFGKTNYLVAWDNDFNQPPMQSLFCQLISMDGVTDGPPFALDQLTPDGDELELALAFDGTNFLSVWSDDGTETLYAQLVSPTGTLLGSASTVASGEEAESGALAVGATNSLLVWQSKVSDSPETWSIYGAFISRSGSVSSPFQISQTNSPAYNPTGVAFDGTNYLVVWNLNINSIWNVDARFVSPNETLIGNEFNLVTEAVYPTVVFDGANYLLSWTWGSNGNNLFCQFLNRSAAAIGPAFSVFPLGANNFVFGGVIYDGEGLAAETVLGTAGYNSSGNIVSGVIYGAVLPASAAPPRLNAASPPATGQFPLTLSGTPGINYAIQASTNLSLADWTTIAINSPTNGTFNFTDMSATNESRFYRAVRQ
ncbi:MAG TPA: hypothetical protein VMF08_07385 [Candidatus Sulfotelmatobacter sp.]|nr:hypothetical protein [Candidatus Sulfotelmatobacter sp.]